MDNVKKEEVVASSGINKGEVKKEQVVGKPIVVTEKESKVTTDLKTGKPITSGVSKASVPEIEMEPRTGPNGTKVEIRGKGFGRSKRGEDVVMFGGMQVKEVRWNDEKIEFMTPVVSDTRGVEVLLIIDGKRIDVGFFQVTA